MHLSIRIYIFFFLLAGGLYGQNSAKKDTLSKTDYHIGKIFIVGNEKTKDEIILRELDFNEGDTLSLVSLDEFLIKEKNKIFNTRLFVSVHVSALTPEEPYTDIMVKVKERWYIFPVPIFKLADRNFNVWWTEQDHKFSRVDYGLRLYVFNVRGRNERLSATVQLGYTKKFDFSYDIPYINKQQKNGIQANIGYFDRKNTPYATENNEQVFFDSSSVILKTFYTGMRFTHRESFYNTHRFGLEYNGSKVADTIAVLNPEYFLNGEISQKFFQLSYRFRSDHRDYFAYPLNGYFLQAEATKLGIGIFDDINQLDLDIKYFYYTPLSKRFYFSNRSSAKYSFPSEQPYTYFRGLGYGQDFVRGYELSVIDGQGFLLNKSELKWQLLSKQFKIGSLFGIDKFSTIPLAIYLTTYVDAGYVRNASPEVESNNLPNSLLYSWGTGIDLVTYYDTVIRLEYSITNDGTSGFFLHFRADL